MDNIITFGKTNHFNTGCYYGPEGQPITWAEFENQGLTGIIYTDHARGITQVIPMPGVVGHTSYCGEKKPFISNYCLVENGYVRDCERNGAASGDGSWNENHHRIYYEVERAFGYIVKATKNDRVIVTPKRCGE